MCIVALCILSAYHVQEFKPIGTAHNRRAQPFVAAANIDDKRQVVSSSYNSPIGLYSSGNIQDALHGQLRSLIPNASQKWVLVFIYHTVFCVIWLSVLFSVKKSSSCCFLLIIRSLLVIQKTSDKWSNFFQHRKLYIQLCSNTAGSYNSPPPADLQHCNLILF